MKWFFGFLCMVFSLAFQAQLSINELSPKGGVMNVGENEDWIEVMNTSSEPVFLGDYFLSDDSDDLEKWNLPAYVLAPSELLLVLASGNDEVYSPEVWQSLVLAENLWRYFPATSEPFSLWYTDSFDDTNWAEGAGGFGYADGDDLTQVEGFPAVYMRKNFNVTDVSAISELILHADYDDAFVAYLNGTEIARSWNMEGFPPAYNSYATMYTEAFLYQGQTPEVHSLSAAQIQELLVDGENLLAIQVNNVSDESSDMSSNFFLSGLIDSFDASYQPIPEWYEQEVGASLFEANFKLSGGESVYITHNSGSITDVIAIPEDLSTGLSYGREPDGTGEWCYFDTPSPEQVNSNSWCYNGFTPEPEINLASGWYDEAQELTAQATFGTVVYTSNGDVPTLDSPVFTGSVTVDENVSYAFRTVTQQNYLPSKVVDRTYIMDEDNHGLPVFSIHTNEAHLWDWEEGIYVFGPNADTENFPHPGSNFWQPWSKFSRLEFFDGNKELKAEEQLDLEIHGGWSRGYNQKSFRFDFKSIYSGNLEEALFTQKPFIEEVNNINIRNGGQHVWGTKIQDGLFSRVVNDLHLDNMAYEPCLLYLNGEFWGVYGIREKMDGHYIESNHGVNSNGIDLMNRWGVMEGSDEHFITTHQLLMNTSPSFSGFYETASSRIDMENYIDYFIAQTYFQNKDWMGIEWGLNNVKLWRPQTVDGRWRYMMYDLDFGFGFIWGDIETNFILSARNPLYPSMHSEIFDRLLENEQFKCQFAQRYADLINTTFHPDTFIQKTDEVVAQMSAAMEIHTDRWAENVSVPDWYSEVYGLVNYNSTRIPTAREHLNQELNLGGQSTITLNVFPEGAGSIQISTIEPTSFPWTGVYFNGCPVQIIATPAEGYVFDSWDANGIITEGSEDEVLLENLFQDDVFTANFSLLDNSIFVSELTTSASLEVYPNPTQGETTLKYASALIEDLNIRVMDGLGRLLLEKTIPKVNREYLLDLDLSPYGKGIYVIEVTTKSTSFSRKVALQ